MPDSTEARSIAADLIADCGWTNAIAHMLRTIAETPGWRAKGRALMLLTAVVFA